MIARWMALAAVCLTPAATLADGRRPLVVELFTSEGCSSCPPADAVLTELSHSGADLLPLSFHVTTWNRLGWLDPFSLAAATERQRRYVGLSIAPQVYTPEMVVDGRLDVIGSDRVAVTAALARAAAQAGAPVPVGLSRAGGEVAVTVGAGSSPAHATVWLIGFDRQHRTPVARGENGGRTLLETNVVRALDPVGSWAGQELCLHVPAPAGEDVAVLVQAENGRILGAARLASPAS